MADSPDAESASRGLILVVEDEPSVLKALRIGLSANGYEVLGARTGELALDGARESTPDLVLLDLGLPDIDGVDVIERLRTWYSAPIIVVSARRSRGDKVEALDLGADDYITKPYEMDELLARIRAALRRRDTAQSDRPSVRASSGFTVDLASGRVTTDSGDTVKVTPTEWHVLEVLVRNEGRLVSHAELLGEVWGPGHETETNYLRIYVAQLRAKLEPDPARPLHILTEQGRGYRFSAG